MRHRLLIALVLCSLLPQFSLAQKSQGKEPAGKAAEKKESPQPAPKQPASRTPEELAELRALAENGDAKSQAILAVLYEIGDGVPQSKREAAKWYRMAAEQGYPDAQTSLALLYLMGEGVQHNLPEAAKWARKAADQGHVTGQVILGHLYADGLGVRKDSVEAFKWYLLAAAEDDKEAQKSLEKLAPGLTKKQRSDGENRARDFRPQLTQWTEEAVPNGDFLDAPPKFTGSGFFITNDGYCISNEHVATTGAVVRLTTAKGTIAATVVKVDRVNDLALLKAEGEFMALPVTSSRSVRLGATAATVGFPNVGLQGFSPKLSKGEIASLAGIRDDARHFQISVPVQPGNSGGALVDERGNVIGVVSGKLAERAARASSGVQAENVNYAVKSSYLLNFLESVPEIADKLKNPNEEERRFEEVVKEVQQAAVLVLVN